MEHLGSKCNINTMTNTRKLPNNGKAAFMIPTKGHYQNIFVYLLRISRRCEAHLRTFTNSLSPKLYDVMPISSHNVIESQTDIDSQLPKRQEVSG